MLTAGSHPLERNDAKMVQASHPQRTEPSRAALEHVKSCATADPLAWQQTTAALAARYELTRSAADRWLGALVAAYYDQSKRPVPNTVSERQAPEPAAATAALEQVA